MKKILAEIADWFIEKFCYKEWIQLQEKRKIRNLMYYGISIEKVFTQTGTVGNKND